MTRVHNLCSSRFDKLYSNIKSFDEYENVIINNTEYILSRFSRSPKDAEVYVIIGLDCTNIYSTEYNGKTITVLCLESIDGDLNAMNLLLSHECHHWIRDTFYHGRLFGNCVGERIVTEGLAINCSEYLFRGLESFEYNYVPQDTVHWVKSNYDKIDSLIQENLSLNDFESGFFSRYVTSGLIQDEPPRIGYVYVYLKVKEYLKKMDSNPIESVGINWESIFKGKKFYC
jgi:small nuclear ribonucleoprotein (snRNP)-like protein